MSATLSVRLDPTVKKRLEVLASRAKRTKSYLAAQAIAAFVDTEEWQLSEMREGIADLDRGRKVSHEKVSKWLRTWGRKTKRIE